MKQVCYQKNSDQTATHRIQYQPSQNHAALCDTLFRALIVRFTGRLGRFRLYSQRKKKQCFLPTPSDINDFLAFMKTTVHPKSKSGSIGQWMSKQHQGSIPKSTQNFTGFEEFIREVVSCLPDTVTQMIRGNTARDGRASAVMTLKNMLLLCARNDASGHLHFMAQIIVADVEEIFEEPFGEVFAKDVVAGQGGKEGHMMLKNSGGAKKLVDALADIIKYVNLTLSEEELKVLGYERDKSDRVVNMVNKRPFNAICAEHTLCKLWMIAKLTLPAYNMSKYPRPTKPHCHSLKLPNGEDILCDEVKEIMSCIVSAFSCVKVKLGTPSFCLTRMESLHL